MLSLSHTQSLSLPRPHSLPHTHTPSLTHSLTPTNTHTHTHTHTLSLSLSPIHSHILSPSLSLPQPTIMFLSSGTPGWVAKECANISSVRTIPLDPVVSQTRHQLLWERLRNIDTYIAIVTDTGTYSHLLWGDWEILTRTGVLTLILVLTLIHCGSDWQARTCTVLSSLTAVFICRIYDAAFIILNLLCRIHYSLRNYWNCTPLHYF